MRGVRATRRMVSIDNFMITIGKEPVGELLRRGDIFAWLPGISVEEWKKIRTQLHEHKLPGCTRPYYFKRQVRAKLVDPIMKQG